MASDFWIVLQWWGTLFLVGAVAWPLTKKLFGSALTGSDPVKKQGLTPIVPPTVGWYDQGYFFSKAVGMATVSWMVYVLGTLKVVPFSVASIGVALGAVFLLGLWGNKGSRGDGGGKGNWGRIIIEEVFFLAALLFWSWVKAHEPSIRGLEKFMDYGFMQSILNSQYFPPADMWYAGLPINYYYFGHLVTATTTKLSGLDLAYTFNLMLATVFALTLTMSFSIGYQLARHSRPVSQYGVNSGGNPVKTKDGSPTGTGMTNMLAGILTAFLVTIAGNMQTIYAFTRGYSGERVEPFWELGWKMGEIGGVREIWGKLGEGFNTYWYANATRFIPFTIHEFPGYSFVVSDVHGHVLSIPFVLLAIALLVRLFIHGYEPRDSLAKRIGRTNTIFLQESLAFAPLIFYGFLVGVLLMTNALDGPIYFGLFVLVLFFTNSPFSPSYFKRGLGELLVVLVAVLFTSLPFLFHFKSFVTGIAVNCPPAFLANTRIGPLIFEGVEKCQISPLWMWWLLWGFFVYCGMSLIVKLVKFGKLAQCDKMIVLFFVFALALVVFPEFFYFKDIYPAHFRSNTMFKLGYQAFILFSIVAGYTISSFFLSFPRKRESRFAKYEIPDQIGDDKEAGGDDRKGRFRRTIFFLFLIPQLFLVSIFPIFAVRSYFGGLKNYEGLAGFGWMRREYPTDYSAIEWLNSQNAKCQMPNAKCDRFAIVEADGDSYTDYARVSAFTGNPTIIGWPVHEWLWRGSYDVVAPRREEVRQVYESEDLEGTKTILFKYGVGYVIVGTLEREKYKSLQEWKFRALGREVFRSGATVIYDVREQ